MWELMGVPVNHVGIAIGVESYLSKTRRLGIWAKGSQLLNRSLIFPRDVKGSSAQTCDVRGSDEK